MLADQFSKVQQQLQPAVGETSEDSPSPHHSHKLLGHHKAPKQLSFDEELKMLTQPLLGSSKTAEAPVEQHLDATTTAS